MPIVKIDVTSKHILEGKRHDAARCPVSLALKDAGVTNPRVGLAYIYYGEHSHCSERPSVAFPEKVQDFIIAFDRMKRVTPFSFDLVMEDTTNA